MTMSSPLVQRHDAIAELHVEPAVHYEKQLVLGVVSMPDELALELDELDVLAVELADDLRVPAGIEPGERFAKVDLFRAASRRRVVESRARVPGARRWILS
jgi:hypothetical protein